MLNGHGFVHHFFTKLADMRLSRMQSGGLTPEEEEKYNAYLSWPGTLPAVFREDFLALETKKNWRLRCSLS